MNPTLRFPFYAKLAFTLVSLIAVTYILFAGRDVIVPIALAMLFSILLRPVVVFLHHKMKLPNVLASIFAVMLFVIIVGGIIYFVSWQVTDFAGDWDRIKRNFTIHLYHIQKYISSHFGLSMAEQQEYINGATEDGMKSGRAIISSTLVSFTDTLITATLIPIYMFLMLLYRTHFMKFFCKLFDKEHHPKLQEIMGEVKFAVKNYLVGLSIEMLMVSFLTALGLFICDVEYALLLGVITGLLNLIPYIGIMVACLISIFASLTASTDLSIVGGVIIVNLIVQLIDNNILVPMIVSSKVQVNALASIIGIIIGGMIAGVPGMFLAIPIIAIMKVVFDRIKELEPWGYLLGDDIPRTFEWHRIRLPLYSYDGKEKVVAAAVPPSFTETTTITTEQPTKPE